MLSRKYNIPFTEKEREEWNNHGLTALVSSMACLLPGAIGFFIAAIFAPGFAPFVGVITWIVSTVAFAGEELDKMNDIVTEKRKRAKLYDSGDIPSRAKEFMQFVDESAGNDIPEELMKLYNAMLSDFENNRKASIYASAKTLSDQKLTDALSRLYTMINSPEYRSIYREKYQTLRNDPVIKERVFDPLVTASRRYTGYVKEYGQLDEQTDIHMMRDLATQEFSTLFPMGEEVGTHEDH